MTQKTSRNVLALVQCMVFLFLSAVAVGAETISLTQGVNGYTGMSQGEIRGYIWGGPGYTTPAYYIPGRLYMHRSWTPGYKSRGLLKWDLTAVVPAGNFVVSARLILTRYYQTDSSGGANPTINVHRALQPWNEWDGVAGHDGVTWMNWSDGGRVMDPNNQPYGVLQDPNPAYVGQVMGTIPNTGLDEAQYTIDLDPSVVNEWINDPSTNYGMFLKYALDDTVDHTSSHWWGKNCETVGYRPALEITYTSGSSTLAQGVGGYAGMSQAEINAGAWGALGYTEPGYLSSWLYLYRSSSPTYKVRSLLKWDLAGVVPPGYVVTRARLVMTRYSQADNSGGISPALNIHRALQPWAEGDSTWMNWSNGGRLMDPANPPYSVLQDPSPEYVGAVIGTIANTGINGTMQYSVDLDVAHVNDWVKNPAANHGMFLKYALDNNVGDTHSRWYTKTAANADYRPALIVDYALPETNLIANGDFSQVGAGGMPTGWAIQSFYGNPLPTISVVPRDDGITGNMVSIRFNPTAAPNQSLSFYRGLPVLDTNRRVRFSFRYKLGGTMHMGSPSFAISASQGCAPPTARTWYAPVADGKWHSESIDMPLQGLKSSGSVIEFLFNSLIDSNQMLYLADVKMVYLEDTPPIELSFKLPISGVLFTDNPNQTVSGAVRTWQQYSGNTVRLKLAPFDMPDQVIKSVNVTVASPKAAWSIDASDVPTGKYYVSAELLGSGGSVVHTAREVFSRIEPSQDIPRIIDGVTYYKGKPFLPIGLMHVADWVLDHVNAESQRIGAPTTTREQMLLSIRAQGFNSVVMHWGDSPDFVQACLRHGLMPFPTASPDLDWGDALRDHILTHANVPNLLGWYGMDEPTLGERMNTAKSIYKVCKEYSPHRIVWACMYEPFPLLSLDYEGTFADAILVDRYEIRSTTSDLSAFGDYVRSVAQHTAVNPGLLVGATPQVFIYLGSEPTVAQLRSQTYLGLVSGAKAFVFYSYAENFGTCFTDYKNDYPLTPDGMSKNPARTKWWLPDSHMWDAFPKLNTELRTLQDWILQPGQTISVQANAGKIKWMAKTVNGNSYLVAVNPTAETRSASFTFPTERTFTGIFGTPQIASPAKTISLSFQGYEVKVFDLSTPILVSPPGAKGHPDGTLVSLSSVIVSARFASHFYVQDSDRTAGVRVVRSAPPAEGTRVTVTGVMTTNLDGERQIDAVTVSEE